MSFQTGENLSVVSLLASHKPVRKCGLRQGNHLNLLFSEYWFSSQDLMLDLVSCHECHLFLNEMSPNEIEFNIDI